MLKRFLVVIACLLMVCVCSVRVSAVQDAESIYQEQRRASGVDGLIVNLPEETRRALDRLGVSSLEKPPTLQTGELLQVIGEMLQKESKTPLCGMAACIGMLLLCAMTEGFRLTGEKKLGTVQNAVGTMCICTALIVPLSGTISRAAEVIRGAAGFMMLYVPVLSGLLISSGSETAGASYYSSMMMAGNGVSLISSKLVVPLMNVMLALSVTSGISPRMNLSTLCEAVYKLSRWALTLTLSVFMTVLSLNTLVASSMDQVSKRALKFTVSSLVPVVGNVLSEALTTFSGSLKLLKSGAGVLVILSGAMMFLPVLLECIVWQFSLFVMNAAAEIAGLQQMGGLFKNVSKVAGMLTAVLLCAMTVLLISTVILLLSGG